MAQWYKSSKPIIALAAMDGVSDTVFRQICKDWGADVMFTEFIHSTGLIRSKKYRDPILKYSPKERPIIVQIYGNNPEDFYKATEFVLDLGFDGVDINMGCPSKTVAGHGSGCALMRSPELATSIVHSVRLARDEFEKKNNLEASSIPVTVKMRIGYDEIIATDFAKVLEDAGAEALVVHGRTLKMGYSGFANWEEIAKVAHTVKIPVIGNGDVKNANDVKKALDYGCVGVTIGRATFGNPFIFKEIKVALEGNDWHPSQELRFKTYLEHVKLAYNEFGERGLIESRKHIAGYINNFENASELRQKLIFSKSIEEIENFLTHYL